MGFSLAGIMLYLLKRNLGDVTRRDTTGRGLGDGEDEKYDEIDLVPDGKGCRANFVLSPDNECCRLRDFCVV